MTISTDTRALLDKARELVASLADVVAKFPDDDGLPNVETLRMLKRCCEEMEFGHSRHRAIELGERVDEVLNNLHAADFEIDEVDETDFFD